MLLHFRSVIKTSRDAGNPVTSEKEGGKRRGGLKSPKHFYELELCDTAGLAGRYYLKSTSANIRLKNSLRVEAVAKNQ